MAIRLCGAAPNKLCIHCAQSVNYGALGGLWSLLTRSSERRRTLQCASVHQTTDWTLEHVLENIDLCLVHEQCRLDGSWSAAKALFSKGRHPALGV